MQSLPRLHWQIPTAKLNLKAEICRKAWQIMPSRTLRAALKPRRAILLPAWWWAVSMLLLSPLLLKGQLLG